jgi:hypothetical protein
MENIDPKLVEEWNKKLAAEGLGVVGGEKVKIDKNTAEHISTGSKKVEEEDLLHEAMQDVLVEYAALPQEIQQDIIDDVKNQKQLGGKYTNISNRVHLLINKGSELVSMTSDESDLVHRPKPSFEEIKLQSEEDDELKIDRLIEKLENIKYRKKDGEEGEEDEADDDKPKDWIH